MDATSFSQFLAAKLSAFAQPIEQNILNGNFATDSCAYHQAVGKRSVAAAIIKELPMLVKEFVEGTNAVDPQSVGPIVDVTSFTAQ